MDIFGFSIFFPASYESTFISRNVKFINCLIALCMPWIILTYDNENICAFMSMQHYIDNIFFRTLRSLFNLFAKLYPKILHVNIIRLSNRIYSMNAFKWNHVRNISFESIPGDFSSIQIQIKISGFLKGFGKKLKMVISIHNKIT